MIIQFSMKNVLSFKDEVVIDMRSIPAYKEHSYNLIEVPSGDKLLRVASIYGANASGKSNLCRGMWMFQNIVMRSMNPVKNTEKKVLEQFYRPFAFEDESANSNSEYQIVLSDDETEYTFGFEFNKKEIVSEWLYKRDYNVNRVSTILERDHQSIMIGASIRRECNKYKEQIPEDSLVLTFFGRLILKTPVFRKVFDGIHKMMISDTSFYENKDVMEEFLPKAIDENKKELLDFLSAIDTGIKDIFYETIDKRKVFYTSHTGKDGKKHPINLYSESSGTLKSIIVYIFALTVINTNGLMVVDELSARLHPLLLKFIVDQFYNENSKAQLIYTTHDTTLMDKKFFRRDQILFVQKYDYGYSKLSTLSDFKVRPDASFEKDYLAGVYGGIPMLKEFSMKTGE